MNERLEKLSIYGKMRSGKDTVADIIEQEVPYPSTKIAYGNELKGSYHDIFGVNGSAKDRDGYQWFGQAMRSWKPRVWIDKLDEVIDILEGNRDQTIIVTDMRQPNEYEHLKNRGFTMIKVETPEHIRIERMKERGEFVTDEQLNHETERNIDDYEWDHRIINDGSLEDLKQKVYEVLRGGSNV